MQKLISAISQAYDWKISQIEDEIRRLRERKNNTIQDIKEIEDKERSEIPEVSYDDKNQSMRFMEAANDIQNKPDESSFGKVISTLFRAKKHRHKER